MSDFLCVLKQKNRFFDLRKNFFDPGLHYDSETTNCEQQFSIFALSPSLYSLPDETNFCKCCKEGKHSVRDPNLMKCDNCENVVCDNHSVRKAYCVSCMGKIENLITEPIGKRTRGNSQ